LVRWKDNSAAEYLREATLRSMGAGCLVDEFRKIPGWETDSRNLGFVERLVSISGTSGKFPAKQGPFFKVCWKTTVRGASRPWAATEELPASEVVNVDLLAKTFPNAVEAYKNKKQKGKKRKIGMYDPIETVQQATERQVSDGAIANIVSKLRRGQVPRRVAAAISQVKNAEIGRKGV